VDTLSYKTISANKATVNKEWIIVDVKDKVLGRACSQIAAILKGKNKTNYTPHVDCGDNVIVLNAEKVVLTGKKMTNKQYIRHTGHPGGQRFATPRELMEKDGRRVVEMAIKGMLPKTRLGRQQYTNLFVYVGTEHPHVAQLAKSIEL